MKFNYISTSIPKDYKCSKCGATQCKLWRQYNTFADFIKLLCVTCAGKNQHTSVKSMNSDGKRMTKLCKSYHRTDQIGHLIPAIPTEDCDTYWGYTSVPEIGCEWWRRLPTFNVNKI